MLNVGVIGCGSTAKQKYFPGIIKNPDINLVAVYDVVHKLAIDASMLYGVKSYNSIDDIIGDDDIDAFCVCTPNSTHAEIVISAIKAGKHVLCEEPISSCLQSALDMVEVSRQSQKVAMIAHTQQYMPIYRRAKEIIDTGMLGKVLNFRTVHATDGPIYFDMNDVWSFRKESYVYGVALDLGVNRIALLNYLLGCNISNVVAYKTVHYKESHNDETIGIVDGLYCAMKAYWGGITGSFTINWSNYGGFEDSFVFQCENGFLKVVNGMIETVLRDGSTINHTLSGQSDSPGIIDIFAEAVLRGGVYVTLKDSYKALHTIIASLESSAINRTVII